MNDFFNSMKQCFCSCLTSLNTFVAELDLILIKTIKNTWKNQDE